MSDGAIQPISWAKGGGQLLLAILLLAILYFFLWPTDLEPESWQPQPSPNLDGAYAATASLAPIEQLPLGSLRRGPESIAIAPNGDVLTGVANGDIRNITTGERLADTKGRPLGLAYDAAGNLIVADAEMGLLAVSPDGEIEVLVEIDQRDSLLFANDVVVAADGVIYFSDGSVKRGFDRVKHDILENRPNGRLLSYDPTTFNLNILLDDLHHANGIALNADESFVLVAETANYRVRRYWLTGELAGTSDIFIDNLPGYPDGVSLGEDGVFWLTLNGLRHPRMDELAAWPSVRKAIGRLPALLLPNPPTQAIVLGLDQDGAISHSLQASAAELALNLTSATQDGNTLYLGALSGSNVVRFELDE